MTGKASSLPLFDNSTLSIDFSAVYPALEATPWAKTLVMLFCWWFFLFISRTLCSRNAALIDLYDRRASRPHSNSFSTRCFSRGENFLVISINCSLAPRRHVSRRHSNQTLNRFSRFSFLFFIICITGRGVEYHWARGILWILCNPNKPFFREAFSWFEEFFSALWSWPSLSPQRVIKGGLWERSGVTWGFARNHGGSGSCQLTRLSVKKFARLRER